ncbi:MAG: Sua5/YciO/YrdC/YwlC family protein [Candidatus Paceibacterota bacterium]|jgi:L-threonylcarbamoyladenylate synthase
MKKDIWNDKNLIKILSGNGVAVMPTDTIYGLVGKALNEDVVSRIYKIKKRNGDKPFIILIGNIKDLEKFSVALSEKQEKVIEEYWFTPSKVEGSRPTSIILDCFNEKLKYLSRGTNSLSFRLPNIESLRNLISKVGPLVAPSANPESFSSAITIKEAKKYFGNSVDPVRGREGSQRPSTSNGVDLYIDGGTVENKHSKLIKLNKDGSVVVLRE